MRRVIIVGGPRCGKSTMARQLRAEGIPTYCGDPVSKVKEPEADVTYLPEDIRWEDQSEWIVNNWFPMPAPWCCEGIVMARAIRKGHRLGRDNLLKDVELKYTNFPFVMCTPRQIALIKGVETVWNEINARFNGG